MEKYTKTIREPEMGRAFDFIFQNAMGNPIVFADTPTNSNMKANTWGFYGTDLYVKFADGTCLRFAGASI